MGFEPTGTLSQPRTSRVLGAFILSVDFVAVVTCLTLPKEDLLSDARNFMLMAVLAALFGACPVRVPSRGVHFAVTHPFILCSLVALGPLPAGLVGVCGVVGTAVARARQTSGRRLAFNLGAVFLASIAAWEGFIIAGGHKGLNGAPLLGPLGIATAIYFVVNTGLVAAAITLEGKLPYLWTWRTTFLRTGLPCLAGLPLAVALLTVLDSSALWVIGLSVPACVLIWSHYRSYAADIPEPV